MRAWVVLKTHWWEGTRLETHGLPSFPISMDKMPGFGYLPVYASKEEARAEYPNSKLVEIQIGSNEEQ